MNVVQRKPAPEVHTTDRTLFKRCRRKWDYQSPLRQHLEPRDTEAEALWFGTGYHFALEDFHSVNRYGKPDAAFSAYIDATVAHRPENWRDLEVQATAMLDYYVRGWLPRRDEYRTYWVAGAPQCEVPFRIKIPGKRAYYVGTFDRIVQDAYGRLYVEDYKTVTRFDTQKLPTDPQISAYAWAAQHFYGREFEGVLFTQFKKHSGLSPKRLQNGALSTDKSQATTFAAFQAALQTHSGNGDYQKFIDWLKTQETEEGDLAIRRDLVRRNQHAVVAQSEIILSESKDMLNRNLKLYPNPTRDCAWDCQFREVCIAQDSGYDYEQMLRDGYRNQSEGTQKWRAQLQRVSQILS